MPNEQLQPEENPTEAILEGILLNQDEHAQEAAVIGEAQLQEQANTTDAVRDLEPALDLIIQNTAPKEVQKIQIVQPTENENELSTALWQMLRGKTGPQGEQGPQGLTGADSTVPGPMGPEGPMGPHGLPGMDSVIPGPQGLPGRDGKDGKDGRDGKDGKPGPRGPKGADSSPDDGAQIVSKLSSLKGADRLSLSSLKDTETLRASIASKTYDLVELADVTVASPANDQVLKYNSTTRKWENGTGGSSSPLTTKGDVYGYSTTNARVPVGANGTVLTADSTEALGVKWSTNGTGDFVGPASSTDNALVRFDSTTGKLGQNSGIIVSDTNSVSGVVNFSQTGYLDLTEIAAPANPASTVGRLHMEDNNGFSVLHITDSVGSNFELLRDTVHIVRNTTGSTITKGSIVYINGSNGTIPTIALASASARTTAKVLGMVVANIANNSFGEVIQQGDLENINTSGFTDGDEIFLSTTAGLYTATAPTGTNIAVSIGTVIKGGSVGGGIVELNVGTRQDPTLTQTLTNKTLVAPALGTPVSGVMTNVTGTAAGLTAGNVTTNANLTGVVTSVGNATAIADAALSIAKTSGLQAALDGKQASGSYEVTTAKDATGGYAGLTLFKINFKNAANTFTNFLTNATTAARTYTFPDKDGTVAMTSDITGTNSGTNTGDNATNSQYSGLVSNATHTGDATGATALTLATVNANVGSFGSATAAGTFTVNAKGLVTAAGSTTVTPAVGSITGLGTGVGTFLATPSSANLLAAVTDETGTGALVFATSPTFVTPALGTPASGTLTNATGLPIAGLVSSTTQALGVGSVELGHASDTTLSRSAAGVLAVEGVVIPTISSTSTLTNKIVSHTVEPSVDDTFTGEQITGFNATATIAQWDAVYLSTTGWALTDADAAATAGGVMVGLAAAAGTNTNPLTVVTRGVVRNDGWTWATVGAPIYLGLTPGELTLTAPSATDDVVRIVGYVMSDDCIFFNPSNDWLTKV